MLRLELLLAFVTLVPNGDLNDNSIKKAIEFVADVDEKDAFFVAATIEYNALLWTGDLKLLRGLKRKGFQQIITTKDLEQIIQGL